MPCEEPRAANTNLRELSERSEAQLARADTIACDLKLAAAIVNSSEDAIVSNDINGIVTSWNSAAERLFGYTAEEIVGKSITRLLPTHLLDEETKILQQITLGEQIKTFETTRVRKNGILARVSLSVSPIRNAQGEVVGASQIARDITERLQAEQERHRSEQETRALLRVLAERNTQFTLAEQFALVGSFAYDVGSDVVQISDGYVAIYGFSDQIKSMTRGKWLASLHPDDRARVGELRNWAFDARSHEFNADFRIIRPGGEVRWIDGRAFVAYRGDGNPERVAGVNIDVTDRKLAEQQKSKLVAELDHRVKNVLAAVQAVAANTMQTSSSMEQFVAALDGRIRSMGATHELLSHRQWLGIPLAQLVERELAPYKTANNTELGGPEVLLTAESGQTIAMVLHELVTNAAKYGALSVSSGRVSIRWHLTDNGAASDRLVLEWREVRGPAVVPPNRSGYGLQVVRDLIPYELGGLIDHVLHPDGARCQMEIPLAKLCVGSSQDICIAGHGD